VSELALPRTLQEHPEADGLAHELSVRSEPLWRDAVNSAARVELSPRVAQVLGSAHSAGRIVRGLEAAEKVLAAEDRGLRHADGRTSVERGGRVSRLVLLADDGAERFYRNVDKLVRVYEPRVLALRTRADKAELGAQLYGPGQVARLLLLTHKDAVTSLLLALAADWTEGA